MEEDPEVVNSKGLLETDPKYFPEQWTDVVTTNELESPYTLTRTNGQSDGISEYPMFYPDSDPYAVRNFSCKGEESAYVLNVEEPQLLHGCAYYRNSLLIGNSQSGKSIAFDPSGTVSVSGETGSYSLEMVTNENYPTQWYDIIVSGTAANASLEAGDNGYVLKADDLHSVQMTAKNLENAQKQSYSTDADSILFSENNGKMLAFVDLDRNGSYETELAKHFMLGDVNLDGYINAKDASEVLIAAARIGIGQGSGLTDVQQKAADVNHDGNTNAVDASWILRYSAAVGTSRDIGTMEEYMKKL